jgi:O-antigen/teichoic acid export membrane protein
LPLAGSGVVGAAAHAFAPIIVAASGGLLASAAFSILQRFFGPALQGHALLQSPFWPEYTHALASGNKHWLKPAIRASVAVAIATSAAVAGAACMLPWIMPLWLGDRAPAVPLALVAWMAGATIAGIASQPFTYLLLGLNRLQRCSAKIAGAQCATIVLIGLLGWIGGAEGVAAALALGATLGVLPILLIEAQAALGGLSSGDGQKATP